MSQTAADVALRRSVASLRGRARWLLVPSLLGNSIVAAIAAYYATLTLRFDGEALAHFFTCVAVSASVFIFIADSLSVRHLRTLRELGSGRASADRTKVLAAIEEVRTLPDFIRRAGIVAWAVAVTAVVVAMWAWVDAQWPQLLRLLALGAMFGPIASVVTYLLVVRRARRVTSQLAELLPLRELLQTLKPDGGSIRQRVVGFSVIMVVLPCLMLVDVTRDQAEHVFVQVAAVDTAQRAAAAEGAMLDAAVKTGGLALLVLAMAIGSAVLAGQLLASPMRELAERANRIATGGLNDAQLIPAEAELWSLTSTFTLLQSQLREIIMQLQRAGLSIGATTEQLVSTSSKYEHGAADQATSLNQTSATTEQLAQSARQISTSAGAVAEMAQKTLEAAKAGQAGADAFAAAVARMKQDNRAISEAVLRLQKRVQQIGKIVEFITSVADRSDLLALSAELEGTKAGDVGRGFALVAAEMRRLAENVIESTNEIEELIGEVREATAATVAATALGLEQTESGTDQAGSVTEALAQVVTLAEQTSDSVRSISLATQQQQSSTDQLAEAMADILGITQQSLAATKQVTAANHELIALSADLKSIVDHFQMQAKA